jgi:hypothetical protein
MKKYAIIALLCLPVISSCEKETPTVAGPSEQALITLSENFICQPVAFDNSMLAVINKDNSSYLCSYDGNGTRTILNQIDVYSMDTTSMLEVKSVNLKKDAQNNLLLYMSSSSSIQPQQAISQNFKIVKFTQNGEYLSEVIDSIHQPNIGIPQDPLGIGGNTSFSGNGMICFSGGNYAVISSLSVNSIDSTYIQVSTYNSNLGFISDTCFRIIGVRSFSDVYLDSQDRLFLISSIQGVNTTDFLLTDLNGNIIFDNTVSSKISDSYFFEETSSGQFLLSGITNDLQSNGLLYCLNKTGEISWTLSFNPASAWIILSVCEITDGYIFNGFTTDAMFQNGIDWRSSFKDSDTKALILKTDFDGQEQWHQMIGGNFSTAGAISIGNNPISFFGGKFESSGSRIFLIKLKDTGEIDN